CLPASACPHSMQKLASGTNPAPHWLQNRSGIDGTQSNRSGRYAVFTRRGGTQQLLVGRGGTGRHRMNRVGTLPTLIAGANSAAAVTVCPRSVSLRSTFV